MTVGTTVTVGTTGLTVSCTGWGSATGSTTGTVVAGIRWITTCTGGASGVAAGTSSDAEEPLPLTGF